MSSFDEFVDLPRTRDASLNWAADTDPVGPVARERVLMDPGPTRGGETRYEVKMSSQQFGDETMFNAVEPAVPIEVEHAPVQPLALPPTPVPAEGPTAIAVADMRDVPLGTLVFRAGLLPEERLEEALQDGMKTGKRLGEILLERGWVSETDLGRLLAGQKGLPFVELDASAIDPTAPPLLHPEKARLHSALPIGFEGGVPVVAVADPSNDLVVENVRRALACEPVLVVAGRDALLRAINESYGAAAQDVRAPSVEPAPVVPVAEAPAVPQVVPEAAPVVEPQAVVEPVAPVVEPFAPVVPVAAVAPQPVQPVAPQVPLVGEPVAAEPRLSTIDVAEPVVAQPEDGAAGLWLGEPDPIAPVEPVAPVEPIEQIVRPESAAAPEPQPEPVAAPEPLPEPVPAPEPQPQPVAPAETPVAWAVVLRLADGERLEVGGFPDEEAAVDGAREVVGQIGSDDTWPFLAGRFIRPEVIVSVDLVELEETRWLGSQVRAAALGPDQQS